MAWKLSCAAEEPSAAAVAAADEGMEGIAGVEEETEGRDRVTEEETAEISLLPAPVEEDSG